jgi:hypothetical protein
MFDLQVHGVVTTSAPQNPSDLPISFRVEFLLSHEQNVLDLLSENVGSRFECTVLSRER